MVESEAAVVTAIQVPCPSPPMRAIPLVRPAKGLAPLTRKPK
jgi:hypothetical protein